MTHLSDNTPTPVTGVLPTIPQHPMDTPSSKPVSINKIQVPLLMMVTAFVLVAGGIISMTLVWAQTTDPARHLQPQVVTRGGGVAYKNEVKEARQEFEDAILKEHKRTRKMLKEMVLRCRKSRSSAELDCRVTYLPEPD